MAADNMIPQGKRTVYLWYGVLLLLFIFAIFLLWKVLQLNNQMNEYRDAQVRLLGKIDSLRTTLMEPAIRPTEFESLISSYDLRQLRRKGLENPVEALTDDLVENGHLIPFEGSLGGTMRFYEDMIYVLTGRWVLGYFEDGHNAGYMLLEYEVAQGGEISWKVIDTYIA